METAIRPFYPAAEHRCTLAGGLLISHSAGVRRVSWPGWLGETRRHPSSIRRCGRESNSRPSSRESNALATRLWSHLKSADLPRSHISIKQGPRICKSGAVPDLAGGVGSHTGGAGSHSGGGESDSRYRIRPNSISVRQYNRTGDGALSLGR